MNRWGLAAWCWALAALAVLANALAPDGSVWSGLSAGMATGWVLAGFLVVGFGLELRKPKDRP